MKNKNENGQSSTSSVATSTNNWSIKDEIIAGYNAIKGKRFAGNPEFCFDLPDGIRVWIEKDYGMWQMSITRNWESRTNPGETLLDRRAFNLDENYKTMRWSNKVVDRAVELIEKAIA